MEMFEGIAPGSVAKPYFCDDVQGCKLLVAQWSKSDEQFGNQFIDGIVDHVLHVNIELPDAECLPGFPPTVEDMQLSLPSLPEEETMNSFIAVLNLR